MIVWIHTYRPRPAWYDLSPSRQAELGSQWETIASATLESGADRVGPLTVRGQSTQERIEIWTFASLEDVDAYWGALRAAAYADWMESENTVATEPIDSGLGDVSSVATAGSMTNR